MIDLHTHTTASDGRCTPRDLVARAAAAGVTTLGLTDHDTSAGIDEASAASADHGIELVPGIEITAVTDDRDIHILGYFLDVTSTPLQDFLLAQRRRRIDRVGQMFVRLAAHGLQLDASSVLEPGLADPTRAVGRPWIARALVDAGYVANVNEAFDKWLGRGRPGFVARTGPSPAEVCRQVHDAGGLASLAHPVLVQHDEWIPGLVKSGLDAVEAYHPDHDAADTARYLLLASQLGLMVTGGSDYHGDADHGGSPGSVSLPRDEYVRLADAAQRRV